MKKSFHTSMKWLSLQFYCNISMKNVCWVYRLISYGRKLIHFVWCWSFHMKIVSEKYVNELLPPCCIVTTATCSSDIQQWLVSSGIWCCIVTGCLLTILRKAEFLFLDPETLTKKALHPCETSGNTHPMTHHISKNLNPQQHGCENSNLTRYKSLVH
jgi:hypothetical protein